MITNAHNINGTIFIPDNEGEDNIIILKVYNIYPNGRRVSITASYHFLGPIILLLKNDFRVSKKQADIRKINVKISELFFILYSTYCLNCYGLRVGTNDYT